MGTLERIAAGWLLGLWVGYLLELPPAPAMAAVGMMLAVGAGMIRRGQPFTERGLPWTLSALALLAGLTIGLRPTPPAPPPPSGLARMVVSVLHTQAIATGGFESEVQVQHGALLGGEPLPTGALLRLRPQALPEGTRVRILATVSPAQRYRNESPHPPWPEASPMAGRGRLPGPDAFAVLSGTHSLRAHIGRARAALRKRLLRTLPTSSRGLSLALLLGDRKAVSQDLRQAVNTAGLSHVLAVSGLHISVMAGLAVLLLRLLLLSIPFTVARWDVTRLAYGLGIPIAAGLSEFCGSAPSAQRAAATAMITWTVRCLGARPSATATTALTILLLSAYKPQLALHPGFVLSIAATAAVLRAADVTTLDAATLLRASLRVSIATTITTAPFVLWCFGRVPLIGIVANLLAVPWTSLLMMPLAVAHALSVTLLPMMQNTTATTFDFAARAFVGLSATTSAWSPTLTWPVPDLAQGLLLTLIASLYLLRPYMHRRVTAALLLLAVLGIAVCEVRLRSVEKPQGMLRVTFVDVGQGDSALLDMPDGRLLLIDAGGDPLGYRDPGAEVLSPLLAARRRERIDIAAISHPHPDHYGGLSKLVAELPVDEIWDSGQADLERDLTGTARMAAALLDDGRRRGIAVRTAEKLCKSPEHFGAATVRVLWPCPEVDQGLAENDNSLVILVEYGERRLLFAGDIEAPAEARLLASDILPTVDVLKVAHHGSRTSSTDALLNHIKPAIAVISAGSVNRFGHPHHEVVERLQAHGSTVFSLATEGGVTLRTDGHDLQLHAWSGREYRLPTKPRHHEAAVDALAHSRANQPP